MSDIVVLVEPAGDDWSDNKGEVMERSVTLTNEQWSVLAMCAEAYTATFRTQQSEFVATYVTRGQLDKAVGQAAKMNQMLALLDKIQAKLL